MFRFLPALAVLVFAAPAWAASRPPPRMMEPLIGGVQIRSGFGPRHDGFHSGVDLVARRGAAVRAATAGTVLFAGRRPDYGIMIDLRGRNGVVTRYAHLSALSAGIRRGAVVAAGRRLGSAGATGNASGPHLHFEVRVADHAVDPMRYLARRAPVELAEADERPVRRGAGHAHSR